MWESKKLFFVFGPRKITKNDFFGLQKVTKLMFFKKTDFRDLTTHCGLFPQWWRPTGHSRNLWFNSFDIHPSIAQCVVNVNMNHTMIECYLINFDIIL